MIFGIWGNDFVTGAVERGLGDLGGWQKSVTVALSQELWSGVLGTWEDEFGRNR